MADSRNRGVRLALRSHLARRVGSVCGTTLARAEEILGHLAARASTRDATIVKRSVTWPRMDRAAPSPAILKIKYTNAPAAFSGAPLTLLACPGIPASGTDLTGRSGQARRRSRQSSGPGWPDRWRRPSPGRRRVASPGARLAKPGLFSSHPPAVPLVAPLRLPQRHPANSGSAAVLVSRSRRQSSTRRSAALRRAHKSNRRRRLAARHGPSTTRSDRARPAGVACHRPSLLPEDGERDRNRR
jgi:hypothetical protein